MNNLKKILKKQIELIKPDKDTLIEIKRIADKISKEILSNLKKENIEAEVFIGGSVAKDTVIKTDDNIYDVDLFVRFDKKHENNLSEILEKVLLNKANKIHGSRDYFQIEINNIIVEIIPVIKIKKPEDARNVTDLSYFHVRYVLNKMKKNKKLSNEIRLAKSFCHANNSYGAESYIKGFSGYALELLIIHYKSFFRFVKGISMIKPDEKLMIDDEKFYKKKSIILKELNESKLNSPIILIDPTFKERNALSGLSEDTLNKFIISCKKFISNPDSKFFKKEDLCKIYSKYDDLKKIIVKTTKQKGDISGTKSKKFYNFLLRVIGKEFIIKKNDFFYDNENNESIFYLILDKRKDEIIKGPPSDSINNLNHFKKMHLNSFIKNNRAYAKISHNLKFEEFMEKFISKNEKIISDMSIKEIIYKL